MLVKEHRPWHQRWKAGVRTQNEKPSSSPSSGEGFLLPPPSATRLPTSHLLHHSSAVPLSSAHFLEIVTSFKQHLKMDIFPGSGRSKTIKPHPAVWFKFKRPVSHDGLNATVSTPCSLPTPPRPRPQFGKKVTTRSSFKCVSIAWWWWWENKRAFELL